MKSHSKTNFGENISRSDLTFRKSYSHSVHCYHQRRSLHSRQELHPLHPYHATLGHGLSLYPQTQTKDSTIVFKLLNFEI